MPKDQLTKLVVSPGVHYLDCTRLSFFDLGEQIIPDIVWRKPLAHVFTLMRKAGATTLLLHNHVEREPFFSERYPAVKAELEHLAAVFPSSRCSVQQLTFWDGAEIGAAEHELPDVLQNGDILCTCVIVNVDHPQHKRGYLFECVMGLPTFATDFEINDGEYARLRLPTPNRYIHVYDTAQITVAGLEGNMYGTLYCQQNGMTSSCGHSAVRMALWHARKEDDKYQPNTTDINKLAGYSNDADDKHPIDLTVSDIIRVCDGFDLSVIKADYVNLNPSAAEASAHEFAYQLVESGIPTIIVFKTTPTRKYQEGKHHVLPVIGHTMNNDFWLPLAAWRYKDMPLSSLTSGERRYLPSVEWASSLIVHDDLVGPYLNLRSSTLTRRVSPGDDVAGRATAVLGIVPHGLPGNVTPVVAQEMGSVYFWKFVELGLDHVVEPWRSRMESRWADKERRFVDVVLRTQVVTRSEYLEEHLGDLADHEENEIRVSEGMRSRLEKGLPDQFWMTEFTFPELFCANRSKLGEILFVPPKRASRSERVEDVPLVVRCVNRLHLADKRRFDNLGIRSHVPLYRRFAPPLEP